MGLLKPKTTRRGSRTLRQHGALECPHNGHQAGACRGLCVPIGGMGTCGRLAPHGMIGRTQSAIARHKARRLKGSG